MAQKKDFSHVEIIAAIANNPAPVMTLRGLAEAMDCSKQTLLPRLLPLVESGDVEQYDLGTKGKPNYVYCLPPSFEEQCRKEMIRKKWKENHPPGEEK